MYKRIPKIYKDILLNSHRLLHTHFYIDCSSVSMHYLIKKKYIVTLLWYHSQKCYIIAWKAWFSEFGNIHWWRLTNNQLLVLLMCFYIGCFTLLLLMNVCLVSGITIPGIRYVGVHGVAETVNNNSMFGYYCCSIHPLCILISIHPILCWTNQRVLFFIYSFPSSVQNVFLFIYILAFGTFQYIIRSEPKVSMVSTLNLIMTWVYIFSPWIFHDAIGLFHQ